MTQEDKNLLLKDLYSRLSYGVKVCARFNTGNKYTAEITGVLIKDSLLEIRQNDLHTPTLSAIDDIRPYLRPMSSMTEEEWNNYKSTWKLVEHDLEDTYEPSIESSDWLISHHFDYRGLIKKGLALEATEGMYKTE